MFLRRADVRDERAHIGRQFFQVTTFVDKCARPVAHGSVTGNRTLR